MKRSAIRDALRLTGPEPYISRMSKNTSVPVGDHFADFIERLVQAGRYESSSDVVRAGLRLLEEQELKIERLRDALIEGEQSGEPVPFDLNEFLDEMRQDRARRDERLRSHAAGARRS